MVTGLLLPPSASDRTLPASGYSWLDNDWGTIDQNSNSSLAADAPFTSNSGASLGLADDKASCAAFAIDTNNQGRSTAKFHAQGMLYMPSAPIYLTGTDNDTSWSTDGIVAAPDHGVPLGTRR